MLSPRSEANARIRRQQQQREMLAAIARSLALPRTDVVTISRALVVVGVA